MTQPLGGGYEVLYIHRLYQIVVVASVKCSYRTGCIIYVCNKTVAGATLRRQLMVFTRIFQMQFGTERRIRKARGCRLTFSTHQVSCWHMCYARFRKFVPHNTALATLPLGKIISANTTNTEMGSGAEHAGRGHNPVNLRNLTTITTKTWCYEVPGRPQKRGGRLIIGAESSDVIDELWKLQMEKRKETTADLSSV